jgi:DNA repair protein RecN (Recombination protein N)
MENSKRNSLELSGLDWPYLFMITKLADKPIRHAPFVKRYNLARMLLELVVENFAVVERLRLSLHSGLNALTGETGSGKSLVVDALSLLFGGRASTEVIRTGAARAFVSGRFELPHDAGLAAILAGAGIEAEDGELVVEREVLSSGKSRAYAANRPVTAALLREIAPFLGDIHGQHDQQKLLSSDAQRELLDEAAASDAELSAVESAWREWRGAIAELEDLDRTEQEKLRLADLWNMQRREIETLHLEPGEDARLEQESCVLRNVARLTENVTEAFDALSESENSASKTIARAMKRLEDLVRIDAKMGGILETLQPARIAVSEAARELSHYLGALETDPARIEIVESRLAQIEKLKRKYGATIDEVLAFLADVQSKLDALESAGERRAALQQRIAQLGEAYRSLALALRVVRRKAAKSLQKAVESELAGLAMKGVTFRIEMRESDPSPHGLDSIEFLVSANAGEEARPLDRVASGGELSRIALALKACLALRPAKNGGARTLVFDEVDTGVGGAAAETIGRRLKRIARSSQVLCVTHLAQIASFADHHYVVEKKEAGGRTTASVEELTSEQRVREIGRMLSGQHLSDEALRHAARLVEESAKAHV